ncbi:GPI-anchored protein LLG1 [Tripterygium wilfordii]|uniref:GPI-anchored protein LLG1 n=1 Tax=Tripterygium wilfordii TaxID=458696 RepID=UPI0018F825E6|nr:GPI-anchored protein LLG1 [Tripterygium wilfordii]
MIFMLKLKMGWNYSSSMLFFFFLFMGLSVSSTFISDDIFESHAFTGRNLLQAKKACPVNFEFMNYTIITSQCKGPKYPADKCCPAFKQFACPYAEEISDLSTDCASTMFSYINLYGKYPAGIFASECQEGKEGLSCPHSPLSKSEDAKASQTTHTSSPLIMLTTGFLGLLFLLI